MERLHRRQRVGRGIGLIVGVCMAGLGLITMLPAVEAAEETKSIRKTCGRCPEAMPPLE
ncbi:MAG: hypothetical protein UZ03_NOB001002047 [Nitrospira sp. OLB3]|nr:MAG: hypothetical protein UZ03_NOB001002047 [Nitrospira sp. OLB3]